MYVCVYVCVDCTNNYVTTEQPARAKDDFEKNE